MKELSFFVKQCQYVIGSVEKNRQQKPEGCKDK